MGAWFGGQLHRADEAQDREWGAAQNTHPDTCTPAASCDLSEQDRHSGPPKPAPRSHQLPPEQRPDGSETWRKGQTCSASRNLAATALHTRDLPPRAGRCAHCCTCCVFAPSDSTAPGRKPGFQPCSVRPLLQWVLSSFVPQMQTEGLNYRLNLLLNHHMDVRIQLPFTSTRPMA